MGVLKPIKPLNSISLEVDGSNLHPCSVGGSVEPKIALRTRDPSDRVSFFPSWEVHLHAFLDVDVEDGSRLMDLQLGKRRQKQLWELFRKVEAAEMATGQQERDSNTI
ncbi:hypothetical protein BHE74_00028706 [Ensete ventricosum]|nr:hypothetical protein BHE74_00028706 [Ensete ventricosum]RZS00515.1 hypothetical protein BHM03_00030218 [Ensete ventricosum]